MERHIFSRLFSRYEIHPIWSMARIGNFNGGSKFEVRVYAKEGDIAHFHVVDEQKNREACVQIEKPEYFIHGKKTFMFNSGQKRELIDFLKTVSLYEEDHGKTYCELIWEEWNRNNPDHRIEKPESMPDYELLPSKK